MVRKLQFNFVSAKRNVKPSAEAAISKRPPPATPGHSGQMMIKKPLMTLTTQVEVTIPVQEV